MAPIQIGLDLATSLSVIGAAVAFVYTQLSQARRARSHSIRAQRVEHMSKVCADLATILEQGDEIVARVRKAQAGRDVSVTADDYTDFCIRVDRYCRINAVCTFMVWATEQEKAILNGLSATAREWNKHLVAAVVSRDRASVPSFDALIEQLTTEIESFSTLLRKEVERTAA